MAEKLFFRHMEQLLHYIWQQKRFLAFPQSTTDGRPVEVIDTGRLNTDGGPDFFNAKIRIGDTLWAGNVEIHVRSSDWHRHGHDKDRAYDNVILHVVKEADCAVYRTDGKAIPQCELRYPEPIAEKFRQWQQQPQRIACADELGKVPGIVISSWKNALLVERLEQKTGFITGMLEQNKGFWEEAFYVGLARNFGFHVNGQAFELLARSLPVACLGKHRDDLFQLEALLFGQSGLLSGETDEYACRLQKEYAFLGHKFGLQPLDGSLWKMLRLRPVNFPHVRIAQFAALVHRSDKLFSRILETDTVPALQKLFDVQAAAYWDTHYRFGKATRLQPKHLGVSAVNTLLINTVVPFVFAYGKSKNNFTLQEKAVDLLSQIPAEQNSQINRWRELGLKVENAFDSQALLQLRQQYCNEKKCLHCRIAHKILE